MTARARTPGRTVLRGLGGFWGGERGDCFLGLGRGAGPDLVVMPVCAKGPESNQGAPLPAGSVHLACPVHPGVCVCSSSSWNRMSCHLFSCLSRWHFLPIARTGFDPGEERMGRGWRGFVMDFGPAR